MPGGSISIAGIEIPSTNPLFLAFLAFHVFFALICVVSGIWAMVSKKQPGLHPSSGRIYYWSLLPVFVSSSLLSIMRWTEDYHLFAIGVFSYATANIGRYAIRRRPRNSLRLHIIGMGLSYTLLIVAFYVDNGKSLPVWRDLPHALYWLLPSAVGLILIVRTLSKYSSGRRQTTPQQH